MIKRTFDPGFRIELHQKDLNLALAGARELGVSLPNTATARSCSMPARRTAARPGTTRRWCGRSEIMANFEIGISERQVVTEPRSPNNTGLG